MESFEVKSSIRCDAGRGTREGWEIHERMTSHVIATSTSTLPSRRQHQHKTEFWIFRFEVSLRRCTFLKLKCM